MSKNTETPAVVIAAERTLRWFKTVTIGSFVGLYCVAAPWWTLHGIDADYHLLTWGLPVLIGGLSHLFWQQHRSKSDEISNAEEVIRVYKQRQLETNQRKIEAALSSELDEEELPADHPLQGIAARVRGLGGDDARVTKMVDTLLTRLDAVSQDTHSLKEAISTEQSLSSSVNEPRIERLSQVLADKKAVVAQIENALQDLHAELTVRQNEDHEPLFEQVSDLLAGLSAETEVEQLLANTEADEEHRRRMQAIQAQRERS